VFVLPSACDANLMLSNSYEVPPKYHPSCKIDGGISWIYRRLEKLVVYVLCVSSHEIDGGIT
jgi:hypothetical protein